MGALARGDVVNAVKFKPSKSHDAHRRESNLNDKPTKRRMELMREQANKARGHLQASRNHTQNELNCSDSEDTRLDKIKRDQQSDAAKELGMESDCSMNQHNDAEQADKILDMIQQNTIMSSHHSNSAKSALDQAAYSTPSKPAAKRKKPVAAASKSDNAGTSKEESERLVRTVQKETQEQERKKKAASKPRRSRAKPNGRAPLKPLDVNSSSCHTPIVVEMSPASKKPKLGKQESVAMSDIAGVTDSEPEEDAKLGSTIDLVNDAKGNRKFANENENVRVGGKSMLVVHRGAAAPLKKDPKSADKSVYDLQALSTCHYCTLKDKDDQLHMCVMSHDLAPLMLNTIQLARAIEKKTNEADVRMKQALNCDNRIHSHNKTYLLIPPILLTSNVTKSKVIKMMAQQVKLDPMFDILQRSNIEQMLGRELERELDTMKYPIAKLQKRYLKWATEVESWQEHEKNNEFMFKAKEVMGDTRMDDVLRFFAFGSKAGQEILLKYAYMRQKEENAAIASTSAAASSSNSNNGNIFEVANQQ